MASPQSALERDYDEVSIHEIRAELHKILAEIQASHDEIKFYADSYMDHLPSRKHTQKLGLKLQEVVEKLEQIKDFYGS